MKHKVVSFHGNDLPKEIVELQKKVFNKFNIELEQIAFKDDLNNDRHAIAIEDYLKNNNDWDSITLFDVDCIPIHKDCVEIAKQIISDNNTLYGNAQASNVFDGIDPYKTPPFVAPSFMSFTKKFWEQSNCKDFRFTNYPNPDGFIAQADVGEKFTRENEKQGRRIIIKYPTKCLTPHTWTYKGGFGYDEFGYGDGTEFESGTFHNFQIRIPDKQLIFINYCKNLLNI
jgi:hypothetical protein